MAGSSPNLFSKQARNEPHMRNLNQHFKCFKKGTRASGTGGVKLRNVRGIARVRSAHEAWAIARAG